MRTERNIVVAHLAASPFFGGPERQMLGLAQHLPEHYRSVFLSFAERGLARPFLERMRDEGFEAIELRQNAPHVRRAVREVAGHLQRVGADVLCCHGYKPDVIGWRAARVVDIPVIAVSHGWTAATWRVRLNEALDRLVLRWMDAVVAVSAAQAERIRQTGIPDERMVVIRNAIGEDAFAAPDPAYRQRLHDLFPAPVGRVVAGIGRLSPEKGFAQLVETAGRVCRVQENTGFVIFGDGPLRDELAIRIKRHGLERRFILAGFRNDVAGFLPHLDLVVLPSYTEGLPVVLLEAFAAGVPAVATAVGGTPEVIDDGENGYLVPPNDVEALAGRIRDVLRHDDRRRAMGVRAQRKVRQRFTFARQSELYQNLFASLLNEHRRARAV